MTTGEKIADGRKKLNLTQQEFADTLGVTRQAVSRWESDSAFPETDTLIKISELFDCTIDYLLKYNEAHAAETIPDACGDTADASERQDENAVHTSRQTASFFRNWYYEYKSEKTVFGLPLVHINIGVGRKAKGFFAVGFVSSGIFSFGLFSMGIISLGLFCLGFLSFGCIVFGGGAVGAVALGLLSAGGVAVGIVAVGGLAIGCYALGGAAIGLFACGGYANGFYVAVGDRAVGRIAFGLSTAAGSEISVLPDSFAELKQLAFDAMDALPGFWRGLVEWCKGFAQSMMT